jgi:hypothetical protein
MQFTPAHLDEILAFNWPVAARLVAWARALAGLAAATLPKCVLVEARAILRPAESFIRRLIVIMACRLAVPQNLPSRTAAAKRPDDPGPSHRNPGAQGHLTPTEPITVSTAPFPKITPFAFPGLWAPGMVRYTPPTPEDLAAAPVPATHFFARLARLEAALAAPDAAAKRLALWMARRRAALKAAFKPVRTMPIRPWGLMPGRASAALDALTLDRINYTSWGAQAALEGVWNTS